MKRSNNRYFLTLRNVPWASKPLSLHLALPSDIRKNGGIVANQVVL